MCALDKAKAKMCLQKAIVEYEKQKLLNGEKFRTLLNLDRKCCICGKEDHFNCWNLVYISNNKLFLHVCIECYDWDELNMVNLDWKGQKLYRTQTHTNFITLDEYKLLDNSSVCDSYRSIRWYKDFI